MKKAGQIIFMCEEKQFESPAWHANVLRDREEKIKSGKEPFLDWETVKRQLRDKLC